MQKLKKKKFKENTEIQRHVKMQKLRALKGGGSSAYQRWLANEGTSSTKKIPVGSYQETSQEILNNKY